MSKSGGGEAAQGYLMQAAYWHRQLSQQDVDAIYNGGQGLPYTSW
jgi:hypothetical protein